MAEINIGKKIKDLRNKNGLTQKELADRCELSKGYISQLESEQTSPSIATLMDILECLGTNVSDFFSDANDEQIIFGKDDCFTKENEEDGHTIVWLIPNCQKNDMEPILLELEPGGVSFKDDPHSGEEFGYVLAGNVVLYLGDRKYKLKSGESFYYSPHNDHYIANPYKAPAKILWISTPPSF